MPWISCSKGICLPGYNWSPACILSRWLGGAVGRETLFYLFKQLNKGSVSLGKERDRSSFWCGNEVGEAGGGGGRGERDERAKQEKKWGERTLSPKRSSCWVTQNPALFTWKPSSIP